MTPWSREAATTGEATAAPHGRAVRIDEESGIVEEVEFFGPDRMKMFGVLHRPSSVRGGVIVCSPYQAEFLKNYRREVTLGRALATAGFAVQRFHYRGSGNSDGEPDDLSFDSMREDALAAHEQLVARTGVSWTAFVGTRLGGLVAAAASDVHGAPLVLWEPVVEPTRYFGEIFRGKLVSGLKTAGPMTAEPPEKELSRVGSVDVLGYPITRAVYDSVIPLNLGREVGSSPRPILLLQIGGSREVRAEYSRLVSRWASEGFDIQTHVVDRQQAWWFGGGNAEALGEPERVEALTGITVRWLAGAAGIVQ